MDITRQVEYWRSGASEDWEVAAELVNTGRADGLCFAHLALEKLLKAHVCRTTDDLAPRIHTLLRLVERTDLSVSERQRLWRVLISTNWKVVTRTCCRWRDIETARNELRQAQEMFEWLIQQL